MVFYNKMPIVGGQFPNKEKYYNTTTDVFKDGVIEVVFENNEDLFDALLYKKYLDDYGDNKINLMIWFMPYGQMDRRIDGKVFSFKYFAKMINDANFNRVYFVDPHSNVMPALINRAEIMHADLENLRDNYDMFFYPDNGAEKKLREVYPNIPYRFGNKKRNLDTGEILKYEVVADESEIAGKRILVVDDICMGGRSFKEAAKALHAMGAARVDLFITHLMPQAEDFYLNKEEFGITNFYTCNTLNMNWVNPKDVIENYITFH